MVVTPLYAGLLTLLFLVLSFLVIKPRQRGISLGDGGDPKMLRVIRGHGNFAEYVPLALLMMAVLELSQFSIYVLHAMGFVLLISRLLHGYALSFTQKFRFGRTMGAGLTFAVMGVEAILCIYHGVKMHLVW